MKFEKIFSTNNIMTKLLAPTNAVFLSIKNNKKILYGKDHTKHWNIKMNFSTKIKAALTSLFLAIFGIIIFPSPPSMKYSCEALKWAMLSASGKGTEKAIRHFERKMDLRTFLAYRNGKYIGAKERISFVFKAPVYVIKCFWWKDVSYSSFRTWHANVLCLYFSGCSYGIRYIRCYRLNTAWHRFLSSRPKTFS